MEWTRYTIHTTEEAEEAILEKLSELGYGSVEIEDKKPVSAEESGGLFGDVVPEMPADDHRAAISFYTDSEEPVSDVESKVAAALAHVGEFVDVGEARITVSKTAEEDWINNWKAYFHSFFIDDILIEPTWESGSADESGASMVLHIDPGTAFGTGAHESTQIAIRALRKYIKPGDRMLDIGTGSGILGIIALKSGASHVFGTDLDDNTLPAIADNLEANDICGQDFDVVLGNIADNREVQDKAGYGCYDVACANIIAEILADITPAVPEHLKEGGIYITSGILTEKENIVLDAAKKAGFTPIEVNRLGEWSGIVFRKNQKDN